MVSKSQSKPLVTGRWEDALELWKGLHLWNHFCIQREHWEIFDHFCKPDTKTLEFGSGLSTLAFASMSRYHTAVEAEMYYLIKTHKGISQAMQQGWEVNPYTIAHAPFTGKTYAPVYDWKFNRVYDVIFIDGGNKGNRSRTGIMAHIDIIAKKHTVIIVDDTHRPEERYLADRS